jgi:hypothetical protein
LKNLVVYFRMRHVDQEVAPVGKYFLSEKL